MNFSLLLYFVIFIALWCVVWHKPATSLSMALCYSALEQWAQSQSPFFIQFGSLTNILMCVTLLFAFALRLMRRETMLVRSQNGRFAFQYPLNGWLIILLLAMCAFSTLWSVYPEATTSRFMENAPYLLVVVGLGPLLIRKPEDVRDVLCSTVILGVVLISLILTTSQISNRYVTLSSDDFDTQKSGNPLALASLGGHISLIAMLLNQQSQKWLWSLLRWVALGLGVSICLATSARGQILSCVWVILLFLPFSRGVKNSQAATKIFFSLVLVAVLGFVGYSEFIEGADTSSRWSQSSINRAIEDDRLAKASLLFQIWSESGALPFLIGLGNSASFDPNILGIYPHIVAVEVLCEEGIVGFAIFCLIVFLTLQSIYHMLRAASQHQEIRGLVAALGGVFLFEFLLSFKQGALIGHVALLSFAVIISRFEWALKGTSETTPSPLKREQARFHRGSVLPTGQKRTR